MWGIKLSLAYTRKLLKHNHTTQKDGKRLRYRQAGLLGWNSLSIQQPPTNFKALISLLDSLPDFPFNSLLKIRKKFQHLHFCQKGKPITKFRLLFNLPGPCFSTRYCGCFLKQESSKEFFSLLEGCKLPFNIFGWRKACLANKMLHENACDLSPFVPHPMMININR